MAECDVQSASTMTFKVECSSIALQTPQDQCLCCLSQNIQLISLAKCQHTRFFEVFDNSKVNLQSSVVCYQCHHILKKIDDFRIQVDNSVRILNDQTDAPLKKHMNLVISNTFFITAIAPEYNVKIESDSAMTIRPEENDNTDQTTNDEVLNLKLEPIETPAITAKEHCNVKSEYDSCSDVKPYVPLPAVTKEAPKKVVTKKKEAVKSKKAGTNTKNVAMKKKEAVKMKKAGSSTKKVVMKNTSVVFKKKYDGKITIVTLNEAEIRSEREEAAKKESYLKLPYKCESCITGFDHELTYEDHLKKRHGEIKDGYVCEICKSVFSTPNAYKGHISRHTRRYECVACGKRSFDVYSSTKHYNDAHGGIDAQYSCQECGFTTSSYRSLRYHRDKHKQKPQCSLCGSTFINTTNLRVHMLIIHKQSNRVYSCEKCNKVFSAKSGLTAHERSHEPTVVASCETCNSHFRTKRNYENHMRSHSRHLKPEDKFACTECDRKYPTEKALQEHVDFVHLKKSQHECEKCSRVYRNARALKKHDDYVHKKLRPPRNKICDYCGKGFTSTQILRNHIRTHTGERPHRCPHCAATFAHSAALYTHGKLKHRRGKNKDDTGE